MALDKRIRQLRVQVPALKVFRPQKTGMVLRVVASDGDVVDVAHAAALTSGVLDRSPERGADMYSVPTPLPFSAASVRSWAAGDVEAVANFEAALAVLKVADFLEAPTLSWAERAYCLALADRCAPDVRSAADALLATQTDHIRALCAHGRVTDAALPLQDALSKAPPALHAAAIAARLRRDDAGRCEAAVALQGLGGGAQSAAVSAALHCGAEGSRGLRIAASHDPATGGADKLAGAELVAAMSALRGVGGCEWLTVDGGHGDLSCDARARIAPASTSSSGGAL